MILVVYIRTEANGIFSSGGVRAVFFSVFFFFFLLAPNQFFWTLRRTYLKRKI